MSVNELTTEDFQKLVIDNGKVVIDFWAEWCGPCKMLAPVFKETSEELKDISFMKVDIDKEDKLVMKVGISSIPCMVIYEKGEEKGRIVGFRDKESLKEEIESCFD